MEEEIYVRRTDDRARDSFCQMLMSMIIANLYNSSEGRDAERVAKLAKHSAECAWREWCTGYHEENHKR